jgi:membrane protein DedA with SNARE-associated domain
VWACVFGILGYESSRNVSRFEHRYGLIVVIALVGAAIAAFGVFKWQQRRRARCGTDSLDSVT